MKGLRERPFHAFPERISAARADGRTLRTEADLQVTLSDDVPKGEAKKGPGLLVVLNPEDEEKGDAVPEWAKPYAGDNPVRLLSPRGVAFPWTRKNPPNYVERAHALLGRTVDEGRVWDVAATARYLTEQGKGDGWRVIGRGQAGVIAAYAALFEPSIKEVIAVDPPASHRDGPYFLGVLRVLDTPDALGMLAPRPLTLVGAEGRGVRPDGADLQGGGGDGYNAVLRSEVRLVVAPPCTASPRKNSVHSANQPPPGASIQVYDANEPIRVIDQTTSERAMTDTSFELLDETKKAGRPAGPWANGLPAHPPRL